VLQFLYLKKGSPKAMLWILGCSLGWMLAGITVFAVDYTNHIADHVMVQFFLNLFLILGGGVVLGLVTGPFLKAILRQDNLS
jgi:hypothetical protein